MQAPVINGWLEHTEDSSSDCSRSPVLHSLFELPVLAAALWLNLLECTRLLETCDFRICAIDRHGTGDWAHGQAFPRA